MSFGSISVHLPVSLLADLSTLRQKTLKIGQVGRFLAVFRVDNVFIYNDEDENVEDSEEDLSLIETLLQYMETPQYLRRVMFPYMEELRYVGVLPPLRTPHHPLQDEKTGKGDIREAAVIDSTDGEARLELGLPEQGVLRQEIEEKTRITVKLGEKMDENNIIVHPVEKEEIEEYWGFRISKATNIGQSLSKANTDYNIGTSRYGQNLYEAVKRIKSNEASTVTIAFGGPYQGLFEICEKQDVETDDLFDIMVNAIPQQGVATVRTEEALAATLANLNVLQEE